MLKTATWKERINAGNYDSSFAMLYGAEAVPAQRKRYIDQVTIFEQYYGERDTILISAPGRSEIGGNHTDHQGGRVLAASTSLDIMAVASPNNSGVINIHSKGYPVMTLKLNELEPVAKEKNTSTALVRGMAARLIALGAEPCGFDAVIESNVPRGSGISSSAAYSVLIGSIMNALWQGKDFTPTEIAMAAKYSENNYFGKPSGLLDQLACASGGFTMMDFKIADDPKEEKISCDFDSMDLTVFIQNAGGSHANLTPEYASVPAEMRTVAEFFGKKLLSEVSVDAFYQAMPELRKKVSDRALLRAMHYFDEDMRVPEEAKALKNADREGFLSLVKASGKSSFERLQNVCSGDPAERSVALALAVSEKIFNGKGATRVHGGGFAGTIQAFVPVEDAEAYREQMERVFGENTCYQLCVRPVGAYCIPD